MNQNMNKKVSLDQQSSQVSSQVRGQQAVNRIWSEEMLQGLSDDDLIMCASWRNEFVSDRVKRILLQGEPRMDDRVRAVMIVSERAIDRSLAQGDSVRIYENVFLRRNDPALQCQMVDSSDVVEIVQNSVVPRTVGVIQVSPFELMDEFSLTLNLATGDHVSKFDIYLGSKESVLDVLYRNARRNSKVVLIDKFEYLFDPQELPSRRDSHSFLPVRFTRERMYVSTSWSRPSPKKVFASEAQCYQVGLPSGTCLGVHRDLKPILVSLFPRLEGREITADIEDDLSRVTDKKFPVQYYQLDSGSVECSVPGFTTLSRVISLNLKAILEHKQFVVDSVDYIKGNFLGAPVQLMYHEKSTDLCRHSILLRMMAYTTEFVFLDVEGRSSGYRYGIATLKWFPGSPMASFTYMDSGAIPKGVPVYCKGASRERVWLVERHYLNPVIDLDEVIPWVDEGKHSPFGGVLQMALQVYLFREGCLGSLSSLDPFSSYCLLSSQNKLKEIRMTFNVSDVVDIQIYYAKKR